MLQMSSMSNQKVYKCIPIKAYCSVNFFILNEGLFTIWVAATSTFYGYSSDQCCYAVLPFCAHGIFHGSSVGE